jgi:hypothetical protein
MQAKYFWPFTILVTGALEEALRLNLIPSAWLPYVMPAVTFLAFLVRQRNAPASPASPASEP